MFGMAVVQVFQVVCSLLLLLVRIPTPKYLWQDDAWVVALCAGCTKRAGDTGSPGTYS